MSILVKKCLGCGSEFDFNPDMTCHTCKEQDTQFCIRCHNHNHRFNKLKLYKYALLLIAVNLISWSGALTVELFKPI